MNGSPDLKSLLLIAVLTAAGSVSGVTGEPEPLSPFHNHGIAVPVSESRGSALVKDANGKTWFALLLRDVLPSHGSRGTLLIADLESGTSRQYFYNPKESANGSNYTVYNSRSGRLYIPTGERLNEFDLASQTLLRQTKPMGGNAMSIAEDRDGRIYIAIYPTTDLLRYDPRSGEVEKLTRLTTDQKYPTSMAIDDTGWIYVGIGTERSALMAYHPETRELRMLSTEADRQRGAARVVKVDGKAYGAFALNGEWHLLEGGKMLPAEQFTTPDEWQRQDSMYWTAPRWQNAEGWKIRALSLDQRTLAYTTPEGKERSLRFEYETAGAEVSALCAGPGGKIYGSSAHPMHLWSYEPRSRTLKEEGAVPAIGGGNFTKIVRWNDLLVANSYAKGDFYVFDPAHPVAGGSSDPQSATNPRLIASSSPFIRRPRALVAHPDGRHVISTGYPSYGAVGGGMLIVDMAKKEAETLLSQERLLPDHTIAALTPLPDGNLICGTSILTPGGAAPRATEAIVAEFDFKEQKILWSLAPVPKSELISGLAPLANGNIIGVTSNAVVFVIDRAGRKVIRTQKIEGLGTAAGNRADTALIPSDDGRLFLILRHGILEISPDGSELKQIVATPVGVHNAGPILNGRFYFTNAANLWSCEIPEAKTPQVSALGK